MLVQVNYFAESLPYALLVVCRPLTFFSNLLSFFLGTCVWKKTARRAPSLPIETLMMLPELLSKTSAFYFGSLARVPIHREGERGVVVEVVSKKIPSPPPTTTTPRIQEFYLSIYLSRLSIVTTTMMIHSRGLAILLFSNPRFTVSRS
jgi:hypothetical protein